MTPIHALIATAIITIALMSPLGDPLKHWLWARWPELFELGD